ncbi:MAG: energy transducer TonB [Bacteroidota bacterium]
MKTLMTLLTLLLAGTALQAQEMIKDGTHRHYKIVNDREAEFPGGNKALYMDLFQRTQYPAEAKEKGLTADITVAFFVEPDSSTSEVKAMNDPGNGFAEEAVRLIKETKFAPAIQSGEPVRQQMMLPVLFRIYD